MLRLPSSLFVLMALAGAACLPQVGPRIEDAGTVQGPDGGTSGATCSDAMANGLETDLDCGGDCPACVNGRTCATPSDCQSGRCSAARCEAPASLCAAGFSGCATFTDLTTSATPTVRFPVGGDRYAPECLKVRVGQSVTFEGSFGPHPLSQACGPVTGLLEASSGNSLTVRFDQAIGLYGYYCTQHGSPGGSGMAGAIEVVP